MEINIMQAMTTEVTIRIDTTLTGDLAEKFLNRKAADGDSLNATLAKRLIKLQLEQDEKLSSENSNHK